MEKIQHSIEIEKPVEEVFSYASDWTRWHTWFEGVSPFTLISGTEHGNGTRYAYNVKILGVTVPVGIEIREYNVNKGWKGISTKGPPYKTLWIFEETDKGTRFTFGMEFRIPVPLIGPVIDRKLVKPQWESIIRGSLHNLKITLKH